MTPDSFIAIPIHGLRKVHSGHPSTSPVLTQLEDYGFCKKGEGGELQVRGAKVGSSQAVAEREKLRAAYAYSHERAI
jgi:hypothetical protein